MRRWALTIHPLGAYTLGSLGPSARCLVHGARRTLRAHRLRRVEGGGNDAVELIVDFRRGTSSFTWRECLGHLLHHAHQLVVVRWKRAPHHGL